MFDTEKNIKDLNREVTIMLDAYHKALHAYHLLLLDESDKVREAMMDESLNGLHLFEQMIKVNKALKD